METALLATNAVKRVMIAADLRGMVLDLDRVLLRTGGAHLAAS